MLVGFVVKNIGILNADGQRTLSDLLLKVILPCNIIHSFMGEIGITEEFAQGCVLMLALSAAIQAIAIYGSKLIFRPYPKTQKSVLSYGIICSNSSFVGLPIAEELFGDLGVMYTSVFQLPIRLTMWTAGLSLFTTVNRKEALRKTFRHPCIVSIFIGLLLMVLPFSLPAVFDKTISIISQCTTPISMFVVGSILADSSLKALFSKPILYFTFLRLLAVPIMIYFLLKPFHVDSMLVGICLLMAGMPAGSTTSILANQYGGDTALASEITFTSTLFSIVTIPLLMFLI